MLYFRFITTPYFRTDSVVFSEFRNFTIRKLVFHALKFRISRSIPRNKKIFFSNSFGIVDDTPFVRITLSKHFLLAIRSVEWMISIRESFTITVKLAILGQYSWCFVITLDWSISCNVMFHRFVAQIQYNITVRADRSNKRVIYVNRYMNNDVDSVMFVRSLLKLPHF